MAVKMVIWVEKLATKNFLKLHMIQVLPLKQLHIYIS